MERWPGAEKPYGINATGIGLRHPHVQEILETRPPIPWFEALTDNYLNPGSLLAAQLDAVSDAYPVALHGVGMSLGSVDPLDRAYLTKVKALAARIKTPWISEHLSFTSVNGLYSHDLLPLPFTQEAVDHLVDRIKQVQDFFGEAILVENATAYLRFSSSEMSEVEFLQQILERADCGLLLDLTNLYINSVNHGENVQNLLLGIPLGRIRQIHLAGHEHKPGFLLDAHNNKVADPVWALYSQIRAMGVVAPALIEWDSDIPALSVLGNQAERANQITVDPILTAGSL